MSKYRVVGGTRLEGQIAAPGAKNAVLPIMAASVLSRRPVELRRVPALLDVENMRLILELLGVKTRMQDDALLLDAEHALPAPLAEKPSRELRSSIFLLGSVLARFGEAVASYPGGCEIGKRPIDLHLKGLRALGASIVSHGAPAQPGNMTLLAYLDHAAILGVPGAAISLPTTIFDVLLPQIFAGDPIEKADLVRLADGGLCPMCPSCHFPNCSFGRY